MIYERICNEYKQVEDQINSLLLQMKDLPNGVLSSVKNGKYTKWYIHDTKETKYLAKDNLELAQKLAYKKYLTLQLKDLQHEKTALSMYLRHHQNTTGNTAKSLLTTPEYASLINSFFMSDSSLMSDSSKLLTWIQNPFDKCLKHPEQLIHKSLSGNLVRSKSEALIDTLLFQNHIFFRYESPLILDGITFYPDFTIFNPQTGKIVYWEHFGMMDNPAYSQSTYNKLQTFSMNGLFPSFNLITTFETKSSPLTAELVDQIIHYYFL